MRLIALGASLALAGFGVVGVGLLFAHSWLVVLFPVGVTAMLVAAGLLIWCALFIR